MKCNVCKERIHPLEWLMYWRLCFNHRLERNGEATLKEGHRATDYALGRKEE